ncbi:hypothetical protein BC826DRAFT_391615 [Russula brevipes]|nr:hypothetical protein BC826DRAFT_391615 [Russula brevipes]
MGSQRREAEGKTGGRDSGQRPSSSSFSQRFSRSYIQVGYLVLCVMCNQKRVHRVYVLNKEDRWRNRALLTSTAHASVGVAHCPPYNTTPRFKRNRSGINYHVPYVVGFCVYTTIPQSVERIEHAHSALLAKLGTYVIPRPLHQAWALIVYFCQYPALTALLHLASKGLEEKGW